VKKSQKTEADRFNRRRAYDAYDHGSEREERTLVQALTGPTQATGSAVGDDGLMLANSEERPLNWPYSALRRFFFSPAIGIQSNTASAKGASLLAVQFIPLF